MPIHSSWSDLDADLLSLIFKRLATADRVQFRSVCASWRSVPPAPFHPAVQELPWLVLRMRDGLEDRCYYRNWDGTDVLVEEDRKRAYCPMFVYSLKENLVYEVKHLQAVPGNDCLKIVGCSPDGWVLYNDSDSELRCVHIASGKHLDLPSITTLPEIKGVERNSSGRVSAYYVADWSDESKPPIQYGCRGLWNHYQRAIVCFPSDGCCRYGTRSYIVVAVTQRGSVVFAREGDTLWNVIATVESFSSHDLLFHRGLLYVSSSDGKTLRINLSTKPASPVIHLLTQEDVNRGGRFDKSAVQLVVIDGHLWQIWRYLNNYRIYMDYGDKTEQTKLIRVTKLNDEETKWVDVSSIGGYAAFVGGSHSLVLSPSQFPQLTPDSIYFTDERWDPDLCEVVCELVKFNVQAKRFVRLKGLPHCCAPHQTWVIPVF